MLETKIEELTAATRELAASLDRNSAAMAQLHSSLQNVPAPAEPNPEPAAKPKPRRKPPKKSDAAEPAAKTPGEITADMFRNRFVAYLAAEKDERGKQRLVDTVKPLLAEFGVTKIPDMSAEDRGRALKLLFILQDAYASGGLEAAEAVRLPLSQDGPTL